MPDESIKLEPSRPEIQEKEEKTRQQAAEAEAAKAASADSAERLAKAQALKEEIASREFVRIIAGKPIVLRRWGWGTAQAVLPRLMNMLGTLMRMARTQSENSKLSKENFEKIVLDGTLAMSLSPSMMQDFLMIQAITISKCPLNNMTVDQAVVWLENLEVEEGIELVTLIYKQNVEMISKNLKGLIPQ